MAFSFIHISDIHLGRPFSDLSKYSFDDKVKNICNNAVEKSFNKFIDFALLKNVEFVLIAGDTFDNCEQDFKSKLILKEGLKKLEKADIKVFIICGNHDPVNAYNKNTFPFDETSNIKIIGVNTPIKTKAVVKDKNNIPIAVIHAYSFSENHLNDNPVRYFEYPLDEEQHLFNIGLLHCDLDGVKESPYAPCSKGELQALNYNYWALGHIHVPSTDNGNIHYAGTIQGRNKKETGIHGFKYIKVENNEIVKNSFIPVDIVRFDSINVNLSGIDDITFVYDVIQDAIFKYTSQNNSADCELYLLNLHLSGNIICYSELNDEFFEILSDRIKNDFSGRIYISEIVNEVKPQVDDVVLINDDGISGELYRTVTDENISLTINQIENEFKNLIAACNFSEEEYNYFKNEINIILKDECINLCNSIYHNEGKGE